jgi:hypothetical protein
MHMMHYIRAHDRPILLPVVTEIKDSKIFHFFHQARAARKPIVRKLLQAIMAQLQGAQFCQARNVL